MSDLLQYIGVVLDILSAFMLGSNMRLGWVAAACACVMLLVWSVIERSYGVAALQVAYLIVAGRGMRTWRPE